MNNARDRAINHEVMKVFTINKNDGFFLCAALSAPLAGALGNVRP